jgi:hypothetical protein
MRHVSRKEFWAGLCIGLGAVALLVGTTHKPRLYALTKEGRSADQVKIGQDMFAAFRSFSEQAKREKA